MSEKRDRGGRPSLGETELIGLKVPKDHAAALRRIAAHRDRTMQDLIRTLVRDFVADADPDRRGDQRAA